MAVLSNTMMQGTAAISDSDAYLIEKSIRFNPGDNAHLDRDFLSDGCRTNWTFSCWVKRCGKGAFHQIFSSATDANNYWIFELSNDDYIKMFSKSGGANVLRAYTNAPTGQYRDPSAWMSLVLAVDTPNAEASERVRLWVNGQHIPLTYDTTPAQNLETEWNKSSHTHKIGHAALDSAVDFDGYLS